MSPFSGAIDTPVWTSDDICPGFLNEGGSLACILSHLHRCLRFTSGVTPADPLAASMTAGHIPYMHVAEVGQRMPGFNREFSRTAILSRLSIHAIIRLNFSVVKSLKGVVLRHFLLAQIGLGVYMHNFEISESFSIKSGQSCSPLCDE